jgi:hypothetical protein
LAVNRPTAGPSTSPKATWGARGFTSTGRALSVRVDEHNLYAFISDQLRAPAATSAVITATFWGFKKYCRPSW